MPDSTIPSLSTLDWAVVAGYFLLLVVVAVVVTRRNKAMDTADYFLAGRNVGFFAIGASIFASNIGSEHIVGLAGQGASTGLAMAHYELHAWVVVLLAWVFVPFYYNSKVFTMPEFLEKRFGPRPRWILSLVSLAAYVLTKVSVTVYAGALVFSVLLPDTFGSPQNAFWIGAIVTVVLTGLYTVAGGMRVVLYTDAVQAFILLIGSVAITYFGLQLLGGWGELKAFAAEDIAQYALWRPLSDPDFPWLGIMIASPIVGIWYWCTDQYIVQRTLAAKDLKTARRGALFGAFLKVWPVLFFLIPGLIGAALHSKGLMVIPTEDGVIAGDGVFPTMVASLLPEGLRGLVVAGLMAALMSSLSSLFNSTATLFTVDVYEKLRPGKSEQHLVTVGRVATLVVVVLGLAWIPVMPLISDGGLYQYLQSVQGYLAPPITAVFLLGVFNSRINNRGAVWGLSLGFILGMTKLMIQAFFGEGKIESPAFLAAIGDFNFLYFSGVLFLICVITIIVASKSAPAPDREQIKGLTYDSIDRAAVRASWDRKDVALTAVVLGLVATLYIYFSFWLG
ncbi:sodium/solute symporter [Marinihelvus fidelis]|uniref:Sodium/solute symporter n=1 Tax=Marinihelvus fidelis TaxID=2613842 RepID=A0A5N0TEU1_9GAMM|nr:sodium:solute symporter [Marinihelvus fidelis]KAA9132627.1 sodium/solute symporter [Marinihelvus fidelis]